ncbi:MAG: hypothetical protein LUG44_03390 [Clostridiales bacterium]|nr:hypothetical protein [Clostridiales bacterium]
MSAIAGFKGVSQETLDQAFGRAAEQDAPDAEPTEKDNGLAGKVFFSDVNLEQDTEGNSNAQKLTRIRIGRVTGGTVPGALFFRSPLSSRKVVFTVSVPEDQKEVRALLLYALRDLGLGLYNLGSGYAVGRGYVNVEKIEVSDSDGQKAAVTFQKGQAHTEGSAKLLQDILNSLEVKRDV